SLSPTLFFFSHSPADHPYLHSFPTRRSSDLPSSASIPLYSPERSHEGRGSIADGFAAPGLVSPPLPGADANSNEEGILPLNADLPRRPLLVKEFFEQQLRQPPGVVAQHAVFLDEIVEDHPTAKVPQRGKVHGHRHRS